ncbi:unnamed protein product [Rhizophagus irregularis]|nr:unnamed protein product [Rhizophagus irregularis]
MNQYTITKGQFDAIMKFKDEQTKPSNSKSYGDPKLDKHTQKNAKENMDFLEWIDFSQFDLIKYTGKERSFSTIYSALWTEGPFWNWDKAASIWSRGGPTKVILKRLNDSRELLLHVLFLKISNVITVNLASLLY